MDSEQQLAVIVNTLEDKKAQNITVLDMRGVSLLADYFVICHGNSVTQVQAIATELRQKIHAHNIPIRGLEGLEKARWVLLDLGDIVVHIFHKDERDYYNLERLWSDAQVVKP